MGRGGLRLLAMQAMRADYHPLDPPLPSPFWIQLCSSAIPLFQPGCIWELCLTLGVHCFRLEPSDTVWPGFTSSCCNSSSHGLWERFVGLLASARVP